jgi:hypothetical protein
VNTISTSDPKRELLRHALATLAYRGGKAVRNASEKFAEFHAGEGVRAPGQILAHIGDLMDWALSMANGKREWHDSKPLPWEKEVERFFAALKKFDDFLASNEPMQAPRRSRLDAWAPIRLNLSWSSERASSSHYFGAIPVEARVHLAGHGFDVQTDS